MKSSYQKKVGYLSILIGMASCILVACSLSTTVKDEKIQVGILQYMDHNSLTAARKGFIEELHQQGYTDGETIQISYQNAQGDQANLQTLSEQLVSDNDLVLAIATPAAQSLAAVSVDTPVVFTAVTDPVSADLVDTLEKPKGVLTGTSDQAPIDKQIELLGRAVPNAKTVGILYTTSERNSEVQVIEAERILKQAGYEIVKKGVTSTNDVQDVLTSLMKEVDAVFVPTDNTIASTMVLIGELSVQYQVPVIGGSTDMVDEGGLLTYGTDYEALGRQTAQMAIKILEGKEPAQVSVEFPKTLDVHINEVMAKALGIDPSSITEAK